MAGLRFNEMVNSGELKAPIVIGRDHLDCGSVASPNRETEAMLDGSDAIADWPILNALVNDASGASWVSIHHGGGVGIGRALHAGQVIVADGTPCGAQELAHVDVRSRHGRDPPRRRGLRPRRGGRGRAAESACRWRRPSDGGRPERRRGGERRGGEWRGHVLRGLRVARRRPRRLRTCAIDVADGRFVAVTPGAERAGTHLEGVTIPGLANAHSHAFQRALRGRAQRGGGSFWTWREDMYALASSPLTPDDSYTLALGTYREMRRAGITCVGEFDYVHHSEALIAAANEAGIRLTLLDACYLAGGFDEPPNAAQARFSDGDAEKWAKQRVASITGAKVGAAIHSVRAVPRNKLATVVEFARGPAAALPRLRAARRERGLPGQVRPDARPAAGTRRARSARGRTAVHATHLHADDELGETTICMCPTTERDLADGIGDAGPRLFPG